MSRKAAGAKAGTVRIARTVEAPTAVRVCPSCGRIFHSHRKHAKTCSPACRKRLSRYLQEQQATAAILQTKRDLFRKEV